MSARRARAADWTAVTEIRRLQSRAAEMEAVRAGTERGAAAERHAEAETALDDAQRSWTAAVEGGALDPGLVGHWLADVGSRQAEERTCGEALRDAGRKLDEKRAAWHAARARADAADARRRDASAKAARHGEEARLAAVEDRAARQGKPS